MKTSAQCCLLLIPCRRSMVWFGLLVLTFSGCSSSDKTADRPERTAVSGTVTLDNAPVAGATVIFSPLEPTGKAASGITDAEGHFHLSTFGDKDGAIPGGYEVMLLKVKAEQNQVADVESPDYEAPMPVNVKTPSPESLIPPKYTNPKTSGLRATVPAEGELKGLNFQLAK
ncbi:MAG: carboxypeptidase regulatory-like domain-containing protein [Planctomycetaceae bacterium]|nr:carboxypeptidase regulatory-like domain-containing protein [Planctomycetaceae bacterium]